MITVKRNNGHDWRFEATDEGYVHKTKYGNVYRVSAKRNVLNVEKKVGSNWVPAEQKTVRVESFSL